MFRKIFSLIVALLALQLPQLMHQYFLLVAGHAQELHTQVELLTKSAKKSGKTLPQWIAKFSTSSDQDFHEHGSFLQWLIDRQHAFHEAVIRWKTASVWERPYLFVRHLDWDIFKETTRHFQFGIPATLEAATYAAVAFLLSFSLLSIRFRKKQIV
ncbi:MAG: DUF2937 family protein [Chlamydiia bacterium]|nr:DUF2937 family protein [Chlamydiia bacterium]